MNYKHIKACVQYSGGLMSWGAAKLACDKYGPGNVLLLFADTGVESDGTYRFILQGANALGASLQLIRANAGGVYKTPWDICSEAGFLPDWRMPLCSAYLKQKPLDSWMREHLSEDCLIVIGFSIEEQERIDRIRKRNPRTPYWFPLAERPYTSVCDIRKWLAEYGIEASELYDKGANHANCNGACFQMSASSWARLIETNKPLFDKWRDKEAAFIAEKKRPATILRKAGQPYTLAQLEADHAAGLVEASYYRLPCACGVVGYQAEMDFEEGGAE